MPTKKRRHRKRYFRAYYKERREEILQRRKERYASDPEYRERVTKYANDSHARKKLAYQKKKENGELPPRKHTPRGPSAPRTALINGQELKVVTISKVGRAIGRTLVTLRRWINTGLMPESPIADGSLKYYTDGMVLTIEVALMKRGRLKHDDFKFGKEIEEGWRKLGVYDYKMCDRVSRGG